MDKYEFLEHVFDATQLAEEKVLGTNAIAVVSANEHDNSIRTVVYDSAPTKEQNYSDAVLYMVKGDNVTNYIVGGDIAAND